MYPQNPVPLRCEAETKVFGITAPVPALRTTPEMLPSAAARWAGGSVAAGVGVGAGVFEGAGVFVGVG
ncbi:hypothetical protein GCM10017602_30300 [Herbiconiux flava]|nr:hypothetical protein GCM10017602_30300 [Herbiconiux flava]